MKKYNVPALEKSMAILDLLEKSNQDFTVTEIHTQLDIPKATAFMILNVLESYNVVKKSNQGRYSLGHRIYTLGMSFMTKMDLKKISRAHMEELSKATGFTSHLGIMIDNSILFIDKVEVPGFIKFTTYPGMRSEIHTTSMGKAIAAFLPEKDIDNILNSIVMGRYTPNTIIDKDKFKQVLERIRESGYSIEDEEGELGVRCIGAPVFNIERNVTAAVSITALKSELTVDLFQEIGERVMEAGRKISTDLGYL